MSMYVMSASLMGRWYNELKAKVQQLMPETIHLPEDRARAINKDRIAKLEKSIEKIGLIQPIGVRRMKEGENTSYTLVFGAHRFQAWVNKLNADKAIDNHEKSRWTLIPCVVLPSEITPEMQELLEYEENVNREGLTEEEQYRFTAKVLKLFEKLSAEKTQAPQKPTAAKTGSGNCGAWVVPSQKKVYTQLKLTGPAFRRRFKEYQTEKDLSIKWADLTEEQYEDLTQWISNRWSPPSQKEICKELGIKQQTFVNRFKAYQKDKGISVNWTNLTKEQFDGFIQWCDEKADELKAAENQQSQNEEEVKAKQKAKKLKKHASWLDSVKEYIQTNGEDSDIGYDKILMDLQQICDEFENKISP